MICVRIIESAASDDCKGCRGGNLAVDGGVEYIRRLFVGGVDGFEELAEIVNVQE